MKTNIITFVISIISILSVSCNGNSGAVAVAPENRESFTENAYFKNPKTKKSIYYEEELEAVKKKEYNTFSEALASVIRSESNYNFIMEKNKDVIQKTEQITKSKFYVYNSSPLIIIYFTPIDNNILKGNINNGTIGEINLSHDIEELILEGTDKPIISI